MTRVFSINWPPEPLVANHVTAGSLYRLRSGAHRGTQNSQRAAVWHAKIPSRGVPDFNGPGEAMLAVELFRVGGLYPRAALVAFLVLYCGIVLRLGRELLSLRAGDQQNMPHHPAPQFNESGLFGHDQ